jgi:hypothetical protein
MKKHKKDGNGNKHEPRKKHKKEGNGNRREPKEKHKRKAMAIDANQERREGW